MSNAELGWTERPERLASVCAIAAGSIFLTASPAAADCASLAGKTFGPATITAATNVAPPSSVVGTEIPAPVALNAPFCRIQGSIKPSPDSDIAFEVWLPPQSAWNGKSEGVGNGGFAGSLLYGAMDRALEGGYAVSGTDTVIPAALWTRDGRSAIPKRSRTSAGGRSMRRPRRPRRSSKPITPRPQPTPISAAARTAAGKR